MPNRRRQSAELDPLTMRGYLRERIYGAFSCLSSLLVLASHVQQPATDRAAWQATLDVALTMVSLWAAALFAEILAHLVSHEKLTRHDGIHMLRGTWQIMSAGIPSLVVLLLCIAGLWELHTALWVSIWLVVATLGLFGWLAVRRTTLRAWTRVWLLAALMAIGFVVVALKLLAH